MIPKTIHYCWFGKNPKSELIYTCIDSWKKYLPDYEIKEWNEDNYDVCSCDYIREAYENKVWAFVSDYCRMDVLNQYGGLYFDTDVEIIKNPGTIFDTPLVGFQDDVMLNPGLAMAAEANNWFCTAMLEEYNKSHFIENGKADYTTVGERATKLFQKKGLTVNNRFQTVEGFAVYPNCVFNPRKNGEGEIKINDETVSIHHYAASWITDEIRHKINKNFKGKIYDVLIDILGHERASDIKKLYHKKLER